MGHALRKPQIVPSSPSRARTRAEGGEGVQPPLLVQIISENRTSPSPSRDAPEIAAGLRAVGIFPRKAKAIAETWPAEHIEGWLVAWEADRAGAEGVGALVWRIEHEEPPEVRESRGAHESDWLERRYARGRNP